MPIYLKLWLVNVSIDYVNFWLPLALFRLIIQRIVSTPILSSRIGIIWIHIARKPMIQWPRTTSIVTRFILTRCHMIVMIHWWCAKTSESFSVLCWDHIWLLSICCAGVVSFAIWVLATSWSLTYEWRRWWRRIIRRLITIPAVFLYQNSSNGLSRAHVVPGSLTAERRNSFV